MDQYAMFEKTFFLGTRECDSKGLWKLSAILEAMQNTANEHGQLQKIWFGEDVPQGTSWVLFKMELSVDRYPKLGDRVTVQTFIKEAKAMFLPRYYVVKDEEGSIIARGGSLLLLIDRATRKAVSLKECGFSSRAATEQPAPITISIMKNKSVIGESRHSERLVQYSELDINGHVNNTKYADWLYDTMGMEYLRNQEISSIAFCYQREVLPGTTVNSTLNVNENEFSFEGRDAAGSLFSIFGRFHKNDISEDNGC